ncbi:MAG: DedA family protein [Xenococcaceae cyanobacterium MO_188.B19]|nr:DedA family protein [Xenococcaceae cyanobacterium MO_188.B19]
MSIELLSLDNAQEIARHYGYWAVFIGIALENTGIPLPGETITIVGGFFAGTGELNYWGVLISAIAGAVIGDNFGYWIGRIGGWDFIVKIAKLFRLPEDKLEQGKEKYSKNAGRAVFIGRFITILRILAGPLAGITQMPYRKFLFYNFSGAIVWALTIVTLSCFLGQIVSLQQIIVWFSQAGVLALGGVISIILISLLLKYRRNNLSIK